MKNKVVVFIIFLISSHLAGITNQELYQELILKYNNIETFQADIQQTSYYSEIDYTNVSVGRIYHNPEKIHIDYNSPKIEKISLSDNVVKIYQAEADRLIITYADSTFASLNIKFLIERIWNNETVSLTENDTLYLINIVMTEQKSFANIRNIEFTIDKKTMLVQKVKYQDNLANEVEVTFSNILLNRPLPDEIWNIELTDTTQIIDYRE